MPDNGEGDGAEFENYRHSLLLLVRTQLGTRLQKKVDDSDIVQQTLLEAHLHRDQCRGKSSSEQFAWLRQILTNTIIDTVRRYTRAKRDIDREVNWETLIRDSALRAESWLADRHSSPSQLAERQEQLLQLSQAIYQLSDLQREAIVLFHLQGCSLEDVAQQMNRTTSAVAGLIHRGLKQLRLLMTTELPLAGISTFAFRPIKHN